MRAVLLAGTADSSGRIFEIGSNYFTGRASTTRQSRP